MPWFGATAPKDHVFTTSHGFQIEGDLSEYVQAWIYAFGSYELPTVRFIRSALREGDQAIDVGAQIGYITLVMATAAHKKTHVLSFEPEASNIAKFRRNVALNELSNVTLVPEAVSERDGMIRLYLSADENAGTHSTVYIDGNVGGNSIEIPATTLDHAVERQGLKRVDLIKIDVEGGEVDVIRGATWVLDQFRPIVIAELGDALQKARGFSTGEFKDFMAEYGYSSYTINEDGTLTSSQRDAYHLMDNVVFVPDSRLDRVRIKA